MVIDPYIHKQVPGVEADDVIGTLALRSVDAGYKVCYTCEGKYNAKIYCQYLFITALKL